MGRPRLYNTPEERKAAKATRNKRSYSKFAVFFSYSSNTQVILKNTLPDIKITSMSSDGKNIPDKSRKSKRSQEHSH
jgi:hypothetical protein